MVYKDLYKFSKADSQLATCCISIYHSKISMLTCRAYPYGPCKQQTLRLSKPSCYKRWQNSSVPQSSHTCAPAVGIKSTEDAVGYVLRQPKLRQLLGAEQPEDLTAVELDGGKLNYVFHIKSAHAQRTKKDPIHGNNSVHGSTDTNQIENDMSSPSSTAATRGHTFEEHQSAMKQHINGSETSLLLKYTPPYVKAAGTSFYLTQVRTTAHSVLLPWFSQVEYVQCRLYVYNHPPRAWQQRIGCI